MSNNIIPPHSKTKVPTPILVPLTVLLLAMTATLDAAEIHVATTGNDASSGEKNAPLRTIQCAAERAQPGDSVIVHTGVYRERVDPPRGGESDDKRIVYQTAPSEKVVITGSEPVKGWEHVTNDTWQTTIPNSFFGTFNPYSDLIRGDWFDPKGRKHHTGAVYLNGEWLVEAAQLDDLLQPAGAASRKNIPMVLLNVAWLRPGKSERVSAVGYAAQNGVKNAPCTEGGECIGWLEEGDWVRYDAVNFGERAESVEIRAASVSTGGLVEIRLDTPDGELLGSCVVPNTGGWQSWASFIAKIKPVSGLKTLCLTFKDPPPPEKKSPFWFAKVDTENTSIWAQFKGVNPNEQLVEINVRQTVFTPSKTGINFITVRGFDLRNAATPWAPPTAGQIGLVTAYWCKGWIIEDNQIAYSKCSGIALGKYSDEFDNKSADSAEGYVKTVERALANGWNKETVGSHIVRGNHISHCEQTAIVGSLGCSFSTITENVIHDIHVRQLFSGCEMAGIKFHGAIDTEISRNHIYRCCRGLWLDWMAQGTQVAGNLFHDNASDKIDWSKNWEAHVNGGEQDIFMEVNHGPILVANNILLSPYAVNLCSEGVAFVHNLIAGAMRIVTSDGRKTPWHEPHSTQMLGIKEHYMGDTRFYNNLFVRHPDVRTFDTARLPMWLDGNVYLAGAQPAKQETNPFVLPGLDPVIQLQQKPEGWFLEMDIGSKWREKLARKRVTTELLGKVQLPDQGFTNPDGSPLKIDADYFGKSRSFANPCPGPFENLGTGVLRQFKLK